MKEKVRAQKGSVPTKSSAANMKPVPNLKTSSRDKFPTSSRMKKFETVILLADDVYKKKLKRLQSSKVKMILENDLTMDKVVALITKKKEEFGKNVLWVLICGIKTVCFSNSPIGCLKCQSPLFYLDLHEDFKDLSEVDGVIRERLQAIDLVCGEIQQKLGVSGMIAMVPPIPTGVVQKDMFSHRSLHDLFQIENAPIASKFTLQRIQIVYDKFCDAWTTMACEKLQNWIDPSIFHSFRSSKCSSNIVQILDWKSYSYVFAPWIESVTRFFNSVLTMQFPVEKAKWIPYSNMFDQVVIIGHARYIGKLKCATKGLAVFYVDETLDLDENGLNVFRRLKRKWPIKTLWLIMVGISELAAPVSCGLPKCTVSSCPDPLPAFVTKKHTLGDENFRGISNSEMVDKILKLSVEFFVSASQQLDDKSSLFVAPIIPQRGIYADSSSVRPHDYFHHSFVGDPSIPLLIGPQEEWKETTANFESKWMAMILQFLPQNSVLRKLFDMYILEKEPVFDFIEFWNDKCLMQLRQGWTSFLLKLVKHFLSLRENEMPFNLHSSLTGSKSYQEQAGQNYINVIPDSTGNYSLPHVSSVASCPAPVPAVLTRPLPNDPSLIPLPKPMYPSSTGITSICPPSTVTVPSHSQPTMPLPSYSTPTVPIPNYPVPTVSTSSYPLPTVPIFSHQPPTAPVFSYPSSTVPIPSYPPFTLPVPAHPQINNPSSNTLTGCPPFLQSSGVPVDTVSSYNSATDLMSPSQVAEGPLPASQTSQVSAESSEPKKGHIIIQGIQTEMDCSQVSRLLNLCGKMINMEWPQDEKGRQGGFIMATFADKKKAECAARIYNYLKVFGEKSSVKLFGSKMNQGAAELENEDVSLLLSIHNVLGNLKKDTGKADGPEKGLKSSKSGTETSVPQTISKVHSNRDLPLPNSRSKNVVEGSPSDLPLPQIKKKNLLPFNISDVPLPGSKPRSPSPFNLDDIPVPRCEKGKVVFSRYTVTVSNITRFIPLNAINRMFMELGAHKDEVKGEDCVVYSFKDFSAELKLLHGFRFPDKKMQVHITGPDSDKILNKSEVKEASKRLKGPLSKVLNQVEKAVKDHIKKEVNVYTFKTEACKFGDHCLDKEICHGYHTVEDRRRCPVSYKYSWETCSEMDLKGVCKTEDSCLKIHSSQERLLHFNFYKSTLCPFVSARISCEKKRRICHSAHEGKPDMFYHDAWENLYVEGLENTIDFLAGAIRNLFKFSDLKCPRVLLITPSPTFAKYCVSYIKDLAASCGQNVIDLEENDKTNEGSSVIISTVTSILPILSMKSAASKKKLDLSRLKAIIFDDCPAVFENFPEKTLEIFHKFTANMVNVVVTAEKISQSDVVKAEKHLFLRRLKLCWGTQSKLTDAAKATDSQEKASYLRVTSEKDASLSAKPSSPISRRDNQRCPSRSSQLSSKKALKDGNVSPTEELPEIKLKKRYASPPKSSSKRMRGDETSSKSDSYSKARSSLRSPSRSTSSRDMYRKRYNDNDNCKREVIKEDRKRRGESNDDNRRESHKKESVKEERKKSKSSSDGDNRRESQKDVNDPILKKKVSEKDDIVERSGGKRGDNYDRQEAEEKFMAAVKEIKQEYDREFELFTETPEVHPCYEEKYGYFIKNYRKEFPGKNDMFHCEKLWDLFWKETVKELLKEEYKEKIEGLRKENIGSGKQHESEKQKVPLLEKNTCREKQIVNVDDDLDFDLEGLLQLKPLVQTVNTTSSKDSKENAKTLDIEYASPSHEDTSQESFQSVASNKMQAFEKKKHIDEENIVKTDSQVQFQDSAYHQLVTAKSEELISLDSISILDRVGPAIGLLGPVLVLLIENMRNCWSDKSELCKLLQNTDNVMVLNLILQKCEKLSSSVSNDTHAHLYQEACSQILKLLEYPKFYLKEKEKMLASASVSNILNPPPVEHENSRKFSIPSQSEHESSPKESLKSKVDKSAYYNPSPPPKRVRSARDQSKPESLSSEGHHLVRNEEFLLSDNRFALLEEVCPDLGLLGSVALVLIQDIRKNLFDKDMVTKLIQDRDNKVILKMISENSKELSKRVTQDSSREKFEIASEEALRLLTISESFAQNQKYFGLDIDEIAKTTYSKGAPDIIKFIKSALATAGTANATEDDILHIYEAVATIHLGMTL